MAYKFTARNIHRDFAYFYVGLIISFSISGIALNHRATWNPRQYTIDSKEINVQVPTDAKQINDDFAKALAQTWDLEKSFKSVRVRGGSVRIFFDGAVADFDAKTGKGELETIRKRPVLAEMTLLHQTTDTAWIWYSDIFGVAMLLIAITGMFIAKGKESFQKRGWKFAIVGIIFPLVFLYLLS